MRKYSICALVAYTKMLWHLIVFGCETTFLGEGENMRKLTYGMAALVAAFTASTASAAVIFSSDLSTSAGFVVAGTADGAATFGYDYSADGIPAAPNGADTVGLKLEANLTAGAADEIAAVTSGLGLTGQYQVQVDIWTNYKIGGTGSTEFGGAGVGHDGVTAGRNGASLMVTGDGGSSRDYRLFKDAGEQWIASGQYDAALASNNGADPVIAAAFPAVAPPASQGQVGVSADGNGAFQWMTLVIDVDTNAIGSGISTDAGIATFTLTSAASGNTQTIGTIDNSNGGTVVNMGGDAALIYGDLFSSLCLDPSHTFGVYDNVIVTPEPASLALMGLGGLMMLRRR
jgi:hypothetical protein